MNVKYWRVVAYLVPAAWIAVLLVLYDSVGPWLRLAGATVGLLFSIKVGSWILLWMREREALNSLSVPQLLVYGVVWPNVRPDNFNADGNEAPEAGNFLKGYVFGWFGVLLMLATVLLVPIVGLGVASWLMIAALLSTIHFGVGTLMPFFLRWIRVPVPSLFNSPLRSQGVGDFWSRRWNLPFVEMNRLFVTRPLSGRLGIGVAAFLAFMVSGFLHEMAISYAAGAGWGLPFLYFVLQAGMYSVEQRYFPDREEWSWFRSAWTWLVVLAPLPLLFHGPFRQAYIYPIIDVLRGVLLQYSAADVLGAALWFGAAGHFVVLAASFQVPKQLDWSEDLASLRPLNRRLMYTYGAFIVLTIVAFGVITAVFHGEFVSGNPVALALSGFIAVFWSLRLAFDQFYIPHDYWPSGLYFVVGHALLTTLFVSLVLVYATNAVYHLQRLYL